MANREVALYDKGSREEEAELTLKRTDITRPMAWVLCLGFLVTISAEAVIQHVVEIRRNAAIRAKEEAAGHSPAQPLLPHAYSVVSLLPSLRDIENAQGAWGYWNLLPPVKNISGFEKSLEENSEIAQFCLPRAQYLLTETGAGNEKAYVGRNHWLFFRPEVDYLTGEGFLEPHVLRARQRSGAESSQPDPRKAILQFKEQLDQRGITLIVMPMPSKATVHPEMFSSRYNGYAKPLQNPSFDALKAYLKDKGVRVFDVGEALVKRKLETQQPQFLETDTHWRPETMEYVAGQLKEFIAKEVPLPAVPPLGYTQLEEPVSNLGDIAVMLRLPVGQDVFARQSVPIHMVLAARKEFWQPSGQGDVLLLGDSYTNIYSLESMGWGYGAGFAEQLSFQLQRPVDRISRNDAGSFATRQMLGAELAKGRDRLAGKKVVVWEFATRELATGDWKLIDLKTASQIEAIARAHTSPAQFFAAASGGGAVATGVIESISAVPRPGSVPYKDHILTLHLTDLKGVAGAVQGDEAVVYMWSMRDNKSTAAARYRPGDTVRLRLSSWAAVASKYEAINRSELDNMDLQTQESNWGEIDP